MTAARFFTMTRKSTVTPVAVINHAFHLLDRRSPGKPVVSRIASQPGVPPSGRNDHDIEGHIESIGLEPDEPVQRLPPGTGEDHLERDRNLGILTIDFRVVQRR